jgi:peptidyl-prolyl cis-trans isomerase A (cyclophilin A)
MKIHRNLLLVLLLIIVSCETKTKDKTEKISKQIIKTEKVEIEKPKEKYDLETFAINDDNVVEFLTWYGEKNKENKILIETEFGDIEVELFTETPLHRANFIYLTKKKYFNTTYFHRVVKNFIIQGGSSDESITQKERKAIGKYLIPSEFRSQLHHNYGAMAAARDWEKNPQKKSNPFEFYFIQNKKGSHHLNGEHTVFGRITKGFDVMDKIASQETDPGEYPLLNIEIKVSLR